MTSEIESLTTQYQTLLVQFGLGAKRSAPCLITPTHMRKLLASDLIHKSAMKTIMTQNERLAQMRIINTSGNEQIFIHKLVK